LFRGRVGVPGDIYKDRRNRRPDGILHEPFGLIPLAWLLDFVGIALLVLAWLRRK